jgi:hypothetical protein
MVHDAQIWLEIAAQFAELVDRNGLEFMPTREGVVAELSVEVLIGPDGGAELQISNNTMTDNAGAPIMAAVQVPSSTYRRLSREKEPAVKSLRKRHGKNWDRLVARSRPLEGLDHFEFLVGRLR